MKQDALNIVIAEDHALVREGLMCLFEGENALKVVGEAATGKEAIKMVERLKPDILLLDMVLPEMHGLDVIREVKQLTKIVAISIRTDIPFVLQALERGASGYVVKESGITELLTAIKTVGGGRQYLSPHLDRRAIRRLLKKPGKSESGAERLTLREQVILQKCAEGSSSGEIAKELFISPRTAEMHRANLLRKLGLKSQTDLVRYAIREKIIAA